MVLLLAAIAVAWWALGGLDEPAPELTEAQAQARVASLAEKFDAALQNDRDFRPLRPETQRLVDAFPGLADGHRLLGQIDGRRGDFGAALASFERALELQPNQPALHVLAGGMNERLGRLNAASRHYDRAIELEPDDPARWVRRANVFIANRQWPEAQAWLDRAVAADASLHQAHALLATVHERRGDPDAALHSLERAYELAQVEGGEPLRNYAMRLSAVLVDQGDPALAAKVLRLPEPEDFFTAEVMAAHAAALGQAGQALSAGQYYEQWVRREPANADAASAAVRWYLAAGEAEPARAMLVVLRRIDARHPALGELEAAFRMLIAGADESP